MMNQPPRELLRKMFDAAVNAAQPEHCIPPHLPALPRGRLLVIGAGKASAAMARAVEDHWPGEVSGLVVTRYGYGVPCQRIEIVEGAHRCSPSLSRASRWKTSRRSTVRCSSPGQRSAR